MNPHLPPHPPWCSFCRESPAIETCAQGWEGTATGVAWPGSDCRSLRVPVGHGAAAASQGLAKHGVGNMGWLTPRHTCRVSGDCLCSFRMGTGQLYPTPTPSITKH